MRAAPSFMLKGEDAAISSLSNNTTDDNNKAEEDAKKTAQSSHMVLRIEDLQSFYLSPYLSCAECNGITFINSEMLQKALIADVGGETGGLLLEALPECSGCSRTYAYHIGAKDLSSLIAANKRALARKRARELAASILLQRRMRGVFARQEYARRQAAKHLFKRLLNRGATIIQTQYRGRLGRREGVAEASLAWIKNAHQKLLKLSLVNRFGLRKVFWFKSKSELKLLFLDYKLLCQRLGNEPPVWSLEWNVGEVARRIYKLQCAYATRIQKIFRGLLGRNFIRLYRRERARLWRIQAAGTFIIQRTYRGWWWRMEWRRHREKVAKDKYMSLYLKDRKIKKDKVNKKEQKRILMQRYKKQRKQEVIAKFTGKSPFGAHDGKKMKAFALTPYGDNKVDVLTSQWTRQQKQEKLNNKKLVSDKFARIEYVRGKSKKFQPFETYYKPETKQRREEFMAKIESLKSRFSVIGPGKDWRDLIDK